LRKDLPELVDQLSGQGINDIGITTNGSLINPLLSSELIKRGISDFHIHLPSLNLDAYMKTVGKKCNGSVIKNILDSVKTIKEQGARIEFNTPVTPVNLSALPELLHYCYDNKINLKLIEELNVNEAQVPAKYIKKMLTDWIKNKKIRIDESIMKNRYGQIYQFDKNFFFRIAPVSSEFKKYLSGTQKKILLDGRFWIGSRDGKYLYTASYFSDPAQGELEDVKNQLSIIGKAYNNFFTKKKE
jgi:molybdenum cofactor biosynthesis enzyme MoaA